jgi:hypothetical protein
MNLETARRRQAAALQGAFGTAIFMAARNLALSIFNAGWRRAKLCGL